MWFLTELADGFARVVHDEDVYLDKIGTDAASDFLKEESNGNLVKLYGAGVFQAGFKMSTTVLNGFVDVLRLGDGVKKGGWGYGEDAFRALMIVGPTLRGARWAAGLVAGVDLDASLGNCAWVAGARAIRLTSMRLFASVTDLARSVNMPFSETSGLYPDELQKVLKQVGVASKLTTKELTDIKDVPKEAFKVRDGVLVFAVKWKMGEREVGHALIARWGFSGVKIIDRSGKVVRSLAELNGNYPNIGSAKPYLQGLIIPNSIAVRRLGTIPSLASMIAVRVIPALVQERALAPKPAPVVPRITPAKPPAFANPSSYKGPVQHTECINLNSDTPEICRSYYTYTIVPGDTLTSIARRIYGDDKYARHIYRWNTALLGPNPDMPTGFKVGVELLLPDR